MDNKEAIKQLEWVKKRICDITYSPESFEAINLAIKALQIADIPHQRDYIVINGEKVYITQGHIDALLEYERNQTIKEIVERMTKSFDDVSSKDIFGGRDNVID